VPDASVKKTLIVALGVCLVCSILVSSAAVSMRSVQEENKRLDRITNILTAGDLQFDHKDIQAVYKTRIKPVMINLGTGALVPEESLSEKLNLETFNIRSMANSAEYGKAIAPEDDIARITRMPGYMVIYLVRDNNRTQKVILPVYGKGLWSTMYGFIALDKDLNTINGITFYDHAETPGLGGEIDNPRWKSIWKGKQAFDKSGNLRISVIKGMVEQSDPDSQYRVDGITGATLTSRGVNNTVRFWLGNNGYGLFLKKLMKELHG
jgi:Na+-transporting NADH:ubiquinone oxidoreductase subunit C